VEPDHPTVEPQAARSRLEQRAADRIQHQVDTAPSVNSSTASGMSLGVGVSPRGCPGSVGGW
jgi:hypothetical protein